MEAAESRVKAEIDRRGVQQKARKVQRKLAHQKYVSRVMAKNYLQGVREASIQALADLSMMQPKLEGDLHSDVLPWLRAKMNNFSNDDTQAVAMAASIIDSGICTASKGHAATLQARRDRLAQAEADKVEAAANKVKQREQRRLDREERAKREAKAALRAQINRHIIDKGQVLSNVAGEPLLDIYGSYEKTSSSKFFAAIGGQLQQIYYVVDALFQIYPESDLQEHFQKRQEDPKAEAVQKANNPRELLLEQFFVPFMLNCLKELKAEYVHFMIPPKLQAIIDLMKVPKLANTADQYDFSRLKDAEYFQFRHAFVEEKLFYETYRQNKNPAAMEAILNVICMVICNRVPKNTVSYKCDQLIPKIKLQRIPNGVEVETRTIIEREEPGEDFPEGRDIETIIESNTNEKAVVRVLVPTKKVLQSELNAMAEGEKTLESDKDKRKSPEPGRKTPEDEKKGSDSEAEEKKDEEPKEDVLVDVEEEQNDMALAVPNRVAAAQPPYSVYVISQYAQRAHRNDFTNQIVRQLYDYFQEHDKDEKKINDLAQQTAQAVEDKFISENCAEYDLPCMDFEINAPDLE